MPTYNSKLDADKQISAEEKIASYLSYTGTIKDEELCAEMGRKILLMVLKEFRQDLIDK